MKGLTIEDVIAAFMAADPGAWVNADGVSTGDDDEPHDALSLDGQFRKDVLLAELNKRIRDE